MAAIAGVLVLTSVGVGVLKGTGSADAAHQAGRAPATAPGSTAPSTSPSAQGPLEVGSPHWANSVDLSVLPDTLPAAVAAQEDNVVAITVLSNRRPIVLPNGTPAYENDEGILSGVRIGPDTYETAGHGVMDANGNFLSDVTECGNITIDGTDSQGGDDKVTADKVVASRLQASTKADEDGLEYNADLEPDLALLHVDSDSYPAEPYDHPVKFASGNIYDGEEVFMVDFEPTANGDLRSPDRQGTIFAKPAVFGGVIAGVRADGEIQLIGGGHSYDKTGETVLRPGASGGAVFLADGTYLGSTINATEAAPAAPNYVGPKVKGVPSNTLVTTIGVWPASSKLYDNYESSLAAAPECVPAA